ncbi:MAG: hypothetical protein IJA67_11695 [Oscillospiraceae bacterium]|nr:hypothetical protein [Oscillospiraceae bacterium]
MIVVNNLKLRPGESEKRLQKLAARELKLRVEDFTSFSIYKKSLDARRKNDIHYVYAVALTIDGDEVAVAARCKQAVVKPAFAYDIPTAKSEKRPVVVGFGPGGMFAALLLTKAGLRPMVLERGGDVDSRQRAVENFHKNGVLDTENNVQFGEGGAGTFSDGKLNTNTHDPRIGYVLREFVAHGAKQSIVYDNKPHIGTDVLVKVVRNIRQTVIDGGGEVRFGAKVTGLQVDHGTVTGVIVNGSEVIETDDVILAIGHSARDTFTWLHDMGVHMTQKAFSMGVRIEHLQDMVDKAQYGMSRGKHLPPVSYNLNVHLPEGGSAYTFCMCPGGYVFAAASEEGGVCTNGMSYSGRGGSNANAALLVTLMPEDFPSDHVLSGMEWQREIERAAYAYGGGDYRAPCQLVGDFLAGKPSTGSRSVKPTYEPGVVYGDLREVLPEVITDVMARAIPALGKKLHGFDHPDAVLTGPETRSSSPVRIVRGEDYQSLNVKGLYPCGEGAGYAGGITSAAVDGIRCAEAVIGRYRT